MSAYDELKVALAARPATWLVTGVAGFIGSHLLEHLLEFNQCVIGLDDFSSGHHANLEAVRAQAGPERWTNFRLVEGSLRDSDLCRRACEGVDYVLHQAALASVPQSLIDPVSYHDTNVTGFLDLLLAARDSRVKRFVFASSCALYGDDPQLPKTETCSIRPLSPYAATKAIDEIYANAIGQAYGLQFGALRYFNVFGPRQDPNGAYAAVIPRWLAAMTRREPVYINGDGETSRDFCFVDNVVQANLLAALTLNSEAINQVYNVGLGERTSLNRIFAALQATLCETHPDVAQLRPVYREHRPGDVRHSQADISKARRLLGYAPTIGLEEGLRLTVNYSRPKGPN